MHTPKENHAIKKKKPFPIPDRWTPLWEVFREFDGFAASASLDERLVSWLENHQVEVATAERVAWALQGKWNPKKYTNVRATFRNWVLIELRSEAQRDGREADGTIGDSVSTMEAEQRRIDQRREDFRLGKFG